MRAYISSCSPECLPHRRGSFLFPLRPATRSSPPRPLPRPLCTVNSSDLRSPLSATPVLPPALHLVYPSATRPLSGLTLGPLCSHPIDPHDANIDGLKVHFFSYILRHAGPSLQPVCCRFRIVDRNTGVSNQLSARPPKPRASSCRSDYRRLSHSLIDPQRHRILDEDPGFDFQKLIWLPRDKKPRYFMPHTRRGNHVSKRVGLWDPEHDNVLRIIRPWIADGFLSFFPSFCPLARLLAQLSAATWKMAAPTARTVADGTCFRLMRYVLGRAHSLVSRRLGSDMGDRKRKTDWTCSTSF